MSEDMTQEPDLELQVAVAKVSKYAMSESGDTVEIIERPHGGLSLVMVRRPAERPPGQGHQQPRRPQGHLAPGRRRS